MSSSLSLLISNINPNNPTGRVEDVYNVDSHGLPTDSPPSFESATASSDDLPHKNDETAASIMPQPEREKNLIDEPSTTFVTCRGFSCRGAGDVEAVGEVERRGMVTKMQAFRFALIAGWLTGVVVYSLTLMGMRKARDLEGMGG